VSPGRRQDVKGGRRRRSFSSLPRRLAQWQPVRGLQFPRRGGHGGGTAGEHERGSRGGACRRQIIRGLRIMRPRIDGDRRNHAARAPRHRCERSIYHLGTFYVQAWRVARSSGHAGPAASSFNSCSPMDGLEDSAGSNGIEHGCKQYASVLACSCCCCCLLLGLRGRRVGCF